MERKSIHFPCCSPAAPADLTHSCHTDSFTHVDSGFEGRYCAIGAYRIGDQFEGVCVHTDSREFSSWALTLVANDHSGSEFSSPVSSNNDICPTGRFPERLRRASKAGWLPRPSKAAATDQVGSLVLTWISSI